MRVPTRTETLSCVGATLCCLIVVKELIAQGVSPNRLVAAGFGEFQPIEQGDSEEIKTRNRRIELKLTER